MGPCPDGPGHPGDVVHRPERAADAPPAGALRLEHPGGLVGTERDREGMERVLVARFELGQHARGRHAHPA